MSFKLANPQGTRVPRTIEKSLATGQSFTDGALLLVDVDDKYEECGADPAQIAAVALSAAGDDTSGFNRFARKEFPSGKMQGMALAGVQYTAKYSGTLPDAPGGQYGVKKDANGVWVVDFDEVVNTCLTYLGTRTAAPENGYVVVVEFMASKIQPI